MNNDYLIERLLLDDNYRVCSSGQIFSRYTRQGHLSADWKELSQFTKRSERYKFIKYKSTQLPVHRIVALAFIGKIPMGHQVNHKDGNPGNNDLSNLEIVSQSQNNFHRFRVLGHPPVIGNRKLSHEIADEIREEYFTRKTPYRILAKKYGLLKGHISQIINNHIWK